MEIEDLVSVVQGQLIKRSPAHTFISHLLSDSRHLAFPRQALFFAIPGSHHNGHDFIVELYQKGVRSFIIEEVLTPEQRSLEANFIQVKSSIEALQSIATWHRQKFTYPVLAITGSNGKTIVKEWLDDLLREQFNVVKSPHSYNSQIGVPLSVWQMDSHHNFAIFEAGISQPDEMEKLAAIIQPDIGIFTNIGSAHDEGFASTSAKIQEKLKLFRGVQTLIYCRDHPQIHQAIQDQNTFHIASLSWGRSKLADVWIRKQSPSNQGQSLEISHRGKVFSLQIPFEDEASLENLMHGLCLFLFLGISIQEFEKRLGDLSPVAMRLELKEGRNHNFLIDDSYNHDLGGLKIALDVLAHQSQRPRKVVILSDPAQTGLEESLLFQKIKELMEERSVDLVIGIGPGFYRQKHLFAPHLVVFEDTDALLNSQFLDEIKFSLILVKGARNFAFEKIVRNLSEKRHRTVLEINLDALAHNLNFYRSQLRAQTKLMVMVKAFAYGNGSMEIAQLLQFHRVDYLAVAYVDEGVFLRKNGIHLPIMVLNPSESDFDNILQYQLEPEIYRFSFIRALVEYLLSRDQSLFRDFSLKVHIKLDTGM
ncbi:MAG: UDP-N-acetylmuramoyl-tripeptide--D-alanyl-D-alanine ligase, partial [Bacteroidota bacterium]